MARVTFRETREKGNYITGDYERTTREVEFEGSASDVSRLIATTSAALMLPGVTNPRASLLTREQEIELLANHPILGRW